MMRGSRHALFGLMVLGPFLAAAAVLAEPAPTQPIPGYFDYKTQIFTPVPQNVAPAATKPIIVKGTIIIDVTAQIDRTIAADAFIGVIGAIKIGDANRSGHVGTQTTLTHNGRAGRAVMRVPYQMSVTSTSVPMVVTVEVFASTSPSQPNTTVTQTIAQPANGATTTVAFAVSL